jgi:hypothetical protein
VALFAPYDLTNKIAVANTMNERVKHVFDGEPLLLPIPADAPPDIPRIILTSKDQRYRCNITTNQLILIYTEQGKLDKEINDLREEYLALLCQIAEVVKGEWKTDVFRLGFVVRLLAFPSDPVELIKNTFIREGALKTPRQLEVHVLDRMAWDKLEINRWCRLSSAEIAGATGESKALSVLFDVNTIPEKRYDFSADSIIAFYDRALVYVSESLNTLFPVEK